MDDFFCSFCGKRRHEVRKLVSGRRVFICNECVVLCREVIGPRPVRDDRPADAERTTEDFPAIPMVDDDDVTAERKPPDGKHCSFCGKAKQDVERLVSGPDVFICNECVELCEDILADELQPGPRAT
jgi:ATP-dependent protease Clp ATPase subunit